ncbi:MAG: SCP2 sterol-binding domain-containing protein [Alphaproteobacteria bacterium]
MSQPPNSAFSIPSMVQLGLKPLPLAPLAFAVDRVVQAIAKRHPGIFPRLGAHADKRFLIEPTDLPFVFLLEPRADHPSVDVLRSREEAPEPDARIAGPLSVLIGLIHGAYDGDAVFFSRDLLVEGDMEAVLALRNALDAVEIDLLAETAAALGPLGNIFERFGRLAAPRIEQITGLPLTRNQGGGL